MSREKKARRIVGAKWHGGREYTLGGESSPYVATNGKDFLAAYRQSGVAADIGALEGRNIPALLSLGVKVVATDTADAREELELARKQYPRVSFYEENLNKLPLGDGVVGLALCWRVLHNCVANGELVAALNEINRVLAMGAPLLIAVRSEREKFWARRIAFVRCLSNGNGGIRKDIYFTPGSIKLICELLGFRVDHIAKHVEGGEIIDGATIRNQYLAVHLVKQFVPDVNHRRAANMLIVRAR